MLGKKPFSQEEFKAIYSRVPRLCVELAIKTPKGLVLSLRNLPDWNNMWHMPGGTVFYQEPLVKAAKRVARNELGISINISKLLGYIEYPSEEEERGFGWAVGIIFLCTSNATNIKPADKDSSAIEAFKKLPNNMVKEHRRFLKLKWDEIM